MLTICRSDVPQYLQNSSLFENLDPDDDETFDVPEECFKRDLHFDCQKDLTHYLQSFRYWGGRRFHESVCIYMYRQCGSDVVERLRTEFPECLQLFLMIKQLQESLPENILSTALQFHATVPFLSWLHEEIYSGFSEADAFIAVLTNNLPALRYLHEQGCPWDQRVVLVSIGTGHLECLKYALSMDCTKPSDDICLQHAASFGQIEVLKYFQSKGANCNARTLEFAVYPNGTLACVEYLIDAGCSMSADAITNAAWFGNLECLHYLHEKGCEWSELATCAAALSGELACLMYALNHGCPIDARATAAAASEGHFACLQYAHLHGSPCNFVTYSIAMEKRAWKCAFYAATHCPQDEKALIYRLWKLRAALVILCTLLCVLVVLIII